MREIEFRGKAISNNKWVYGNLLIQPSLCSIVEQYWDGYPDEIMETVDCETVGQYTGRKLNGKKLFEGDVLESYGEYGVIEWDNILLQYIVKTKHNTYTLYNVLNSDADIKLVGNTSMIILDF